MLKNRVIPCLDVKNGRVVKGINFVDLKDAGDPVEQAKFTAMVEQMKYVFWILLLQMKTEIQFMKWLKKHLRNVLFH